MNTTPNIPAISLHQPWASILFSHGDYQCRRCRGSFSLPMGLTCDNHNPQQPPPLKRWETRTERTPHTIIGKRVLIHAAARRPVNVYDGNMTASRDMEDNYTLITGTGNDLQTVCNLPLGAIIGSAVIGEALPIVSRNGCNSSEHICPSWGGCFPLTHHKSLETDERDSTEIDISDQEPFGDWTPGRWAWPITDPVLLPKPIPHQGRPGVFYVTRQELTL